MRAFHSLELSRILASAPSTPSWASNRRACPLTLMLAEPSRTARFASSALSTVPELVRSRSPETSRPSTKPDDTDGMDGRVPAFSGDPEIVMVRLRFGPFLLKTMSISTVRRKVAARRSRPASARADLGHVVLLVSASPVNSLRIMSSCVAVPVHVDRVAINDRTADATGSASITLSMVSFRLPVYAAKKVPCGHKAGRLARGRPTGQVRHARESLYAGIWKLT